MAQRRSFKDYISSRFYDELWDAVERHLEQNPENLDISSRQVHRVDHAELFDITIKHVFIENLPEMEISFDVLVEAEFEITEIDRNTDRNDYKTQWFKISCMGDLSCNLDDFAILTTQEYNYRGKQRKPMSDALVPIISRDQLDDVARGFLNEYYPEALKIPMAIDPMVLAGRMGLSVQFKNITSDCSAFGQIFFTDCETEYYNKDSSSFEKIQVCQGTIFVDPDAFFLRNLGSVNNTVIHECVHWNKHRKAFELERLYNENASQIQCKVTGGIKESGVKSATDWMEWQANALAPRIQMPLYAAKIKASELIRGYFHLRDTTEYIDIMEYVIDDMAEFFGVSRQAAKIRMYDIGYHEAVGTYIYIDGRYVKPHTFNKDSIKPDQTFSLSFRDALIASVFRPELREALEQGAYLFIDSHFCINDPKYITYDINEEPCLTKYALHHMDECCLAFDLVPKTTDSYGREFLLECVLFRDASSDIIFEATYVNSEQNKTVEERAKTIQAYNKEILKVKKRLPNDFSEALMELMKWRGISVEGLAETAATSPKTIQRIRNQPEYKTTLETVITLCIGLKLPPILSEALIEKSGFVLRNTETHLAYRFLLESCYSYSIWDCNELLEAQDIPPLGDIE